MLSPRWSQVAILLVLFCSSLAFAGDPPERKLAWKYTAPSSGWKVLHASEHGVFIRAGQKVAVLGAKTGKVAWEMKLPAFDSNVRFADKWALIHEPDTDVALVSMATGKTDHTLEKISSYKVHETSKLIGSGRDLFAYFSLPKKKLWSNKEPYAFRGDLVAYSGGMLITRGKRLREIAPGTRMAGISLRNGFVKWHHPLGVTTHKVWVDKSASDGGWEFVPRKFAVAAMRIFNDDKSLALLVRTVVGVKSFKVRKKRSEEVRTHGLLFLNPKTGTRRKAKNVPLEYKPDDKPESIRLSLIRDKKGSLILVRFAHKSRAEYRFDLYSLSNGAKRADVRWTGYDTLTMGIGNTIVLSGGTGGEKFEVREAAVRKEPKVKFIGTGSVMAGAHERAKDYLVLRGKPDGSTWLQSVEAKKGGITKEVRVSGRGDIWYGRHNDTFMALNRSTWKMRLLDMKSITAKAVVQCPVSVKTVEPIKGGVILWATSGTIARVSFK